MRVVYLVLALMLLAPSPSPSGGLRLEVAGDGATGVTVRVFDADGRAPGIDVRLVLTATAVEGGRTVGPLQLNPASEGRGFYSSGPVLSPGRWKVVVSSSAVSGSAFVDARAAQSPPAVSRAGEVPASSGSPVWPWLVGLFVLVGGVVVVVRLRRS